MQLAPLVEIRPKEGIFTELALVKELGKRSPKCFAAHAVRGQAEPELVVVERYPKSLGDAVLTCIEEDAGALTTLRHPSLAGVLGTLRYEGDLLVVSQWAEGEALPELRKDRTKPLPLEIGLRVVVDVLGALSAVHAVREASSILYGAITMADVFVGLDGVSRLARPWLGRVRAGLLDPDRPTSMAPELLRTDGERTVRADVFTGGVLLWETLTGWRLFARSSPDAQLARLSQGRVPRPNVPKDAPWAVTLADVAERALAVEPGARYASIAEMAAAIRLVVRSKLASPDRVGGHVAKVAGDRVLRRRSKLEPLVDAPPSRLSRPSLSAGTVKVLEEIRPSDRPPPVAPVVPAAVAPPVKPAKPPVPQKPAVPAVAEKASDEIDVLEISTTDVHSERMEASPLAPVAAPPVAAPAAAAVSDAAPTDVPASAPALPVAAVVAVEATEEDAPAVAAMAAAAEISAPSALDAAELDVAPPQRRKTRGIVWAVVALCLALLAVAGVRAITRGADDRSPAHVATATKPTPPPPSTIGEPRAIPSPTVATAAPTVEPSATAPAPTAEPSATATSEPATTAGPKPSARPHPRPRPTYDPEGI